MRAIEKKTVLKQNFWLTESILKPWHNPLINPIFSWKKNLNKFITKRGLKRKILWVEVNDEGNGKKTKNCLDQNLYSTCRCWADHFHCFSPLIVSSPSVLRGFAIQIWRLVCNLLHIWTPKSELFAFVGFSTSY